MFELTKELFKSVLFAITDLESLQPRPKRITVVSRVYRLLCIKSTTPDELFARKIEAGKYEEALSLADSYLLDSDLVYQQQWRKTPVSADAIHKYLSKVSKKIWAVHQCVDRLPETLPAARELLEFGLKLTDEEILNEINKEREDEPVTDTDDVTPHDLNTYSSELLRCRHVILFYRERLKLYEAILNCEKSTYVKEEYDRLRSHSLVTSAIEIAKEGRIAALTCLWPHIGSLAMQLAVLEMLPETIYPFEYRALLDTLVGGSTKASAGADEHESDWCRKEVFRSIWSSNWSEDTPAAEAAAVATAPVELARWYAERARQIEEKSALVSHAIALLTLATKVQGIKGLEKMQFDLETLDVLVYEAGAEVTLKQVERLSRLETCHRLMQMSTPETFVSDLKSFVVPYLRRYEKLNGEQESCAAGLTEYLESKSVTDLSTILLVLESPEELGLDVRTQLDLADKCLMAHAGTEQLDVAVDIVATICKETDGSIPADDLSRRLSSLSRLLQCARTVWRRGGGAALAELRAYRQHAGKVLQTLTRLARSLAVRDDKPTQQDWEKLLNDLLELQANFFTCVTKEQCHEIYASAILTSGDLPSIRLAAEVLACHVAEPRRARHLVAYERSAALVSGAAREYFNSASSLRDPALELARCCLMLIKDGNTQIQEELDLITALPILNDFKVSILPIQVRLCENKMSLIEECLRSDAGACLASYKLLQLAKLLRIAGDDDGKREADVLMLVLESALAGGPTGASATAAAAAARRLRSLRAPHAAPLLTRVATAPQTHIDLATRRDLLAAAATFCKPEEMEGILKARLNLEAEELQQLTAGLGDLDRLKHQGSEELDVFADAVTTPVIESKDLIPTKETDKPIFNYLMDTWLEKLSFSREHEPTPAESPTHAVYCQEFYRSLYPHHASDVTHYTYDRFSAADAPHDARLAESFLKWYFIREETLADRAEEIQNEVFRRSAEEFLYKDTPLATALLLRAACDPGQQQRFLRDNQTDCAVSAALYAALLRCCAPDYRDNVYLTTPLELARSALVKSNVTAALPCLQRLSAGAQAARLGGCGAAVNKALFSGDADYRAEVLARMAESTNKEDVEYACSIAKKHNMDTFGLWTRHLATVIQDASLLKHINMVEVCDGAGVDRQDACDRLNMELFSKIRGDDHHALINYFNLLKSVDDKTQVGGLAAGDHVKLLKKVKAAAQGLDYKLLLSQPSSEELTAHALQVARPENIGLLTKLLRSLPPSLKLPQVVNGIYVQWLTKYFFSVPPASASSKKWMQQYRQCASYFNKLAKDDLLQFLNNTCFSDDAVQRVPAGTRNLMIMQAVDYCQQEQENEIKGNKNEASWSQTGQELARWARFLENFHSTTIQGIVDANQPRDDAWIEIEKSHGSPELLLAPLGHLVLLARVRAGSLDTLLQCLHTSLDAPAVFDYLAKQHGDSAEHVQMLVNRLSQYHKEGGSLSDELLDRVSRLAGELKLQPHKQIGLISLSHKSQVQDGDDLQKIVSVTAELLRSEWKDAFSEEQLSVEHLLKESARREVFAAAMQLADSWRRKKALVDVLNCWPVTRGDGDARSLQCEYLKVLLNGTDREESLVLIKLLLRKPVLTQEDIQWLLEDVQDESILNLVWIILLSKCEHSRNSVPKLLQQHKGLFPSVLDSELIEELLRCGLFTKLVSTPVYTHIIDYIVVQEASSSSSSSGSKDSENLYTVKWATGELLTANFIAEAGSLQLMHMGVPSPLRTFSQSLLYCKNMFSKK